MIKKSETQTSKKNYLSIKIHGSIFQLDQRHELIVDLIPASFAKQAEQIERLFGHNDKKVRALVEQAIQEGYAKDPATAYFLSMVLLNFGELERAHKLTLEVYQANPDSLLARCAYANNLLFHRKVDEIPAVFNNTFDLSIVTKQRELSLIEVVKFLDIAAFYYSIKNDPRFKDFVALLVKVAPHHLDTKRHMAELLASDLSNLLMMQNEGAIS